MKVRFYITGKLENIFKELKTDIGCALPQNGNLTKWAKEGVLLMNTSLSVREHQANSHSKCGWAWFTDSVTSANNIIQSGNLDIELEY